MSLSINSTYYNDLIMPLCYALIPYDHYNIVLVTSSVINNGGALYGIFSISCSITVMYRLFVIFAQNVILKFIIEFLH